ncbi:MAG: TerD family protein [Deltaproteobacteria bacterium]|jgi:tellurium resistance protein TerD|nr:TerD family protein [Deltaproteobacteria bacterium]
MAVSLVKGANISLSGEVPGLKAARVGLGWDPRESVGEDFDLDASVFLLNQQGQVSRDEDFIFYGNLKSQDGSIEHAGDNLTGGGEGDDEVIHVNLEKIPASIQKLVFTVTIYEAEKRRQNFGMVANAFIRIVNQLDDREIARFDLSEDLSVETAMIFGEIYRHNQDWKFRAVGQGYAGGLAALAKRYGVDVAD